MSTVVFWRNKGRNISSFEPYESYDGATLLQPKLIDVENGGGFRPLVSCISETKQVQDPKEPSLPVMVSKVFGDEASEPTAARHSPTESSDKMYPPAIVSDFAGHSSGTGSSTVVFWRNKGQQISSFELFEPSTQADIRGTSEKDVSNKRPMFSMATFSICQSTHIESSVTVADLDMPQDTLMADASEFLLTNRADQLENEDWTKNYEKLLEFRAKTGHCRIPFPFPESQELGRWAASQRRLKVSMNLDTSAQRMLDEVGFQWDVSNEQQQWDKMCSLLYYFGMEHGYFESSPSMESTLGAWVTSVKQQVTAGLLNAWLYERLIQIGVKWQELDEHWYPTIQFMERIIQKTRNGAEIPRQFSPILEGWLDVQKLLARYGMLSWERWSALRSVGLVLKPAVVRLETINTEQPGSNLKAPALTWDPTDKTKQEEGLSIDSLRLTPTEMLSNTVNTELTGSNLKAASLAWDPAAKEKVSPSAKANRIQPMDTLVNAQKTGKHLKPVSRVPFEDLTNKPTKMNTNTDRHGHHKKSRKRNIGLNSFKGTKKGKTTRLTTYKSLV